MEALVKILYEMREAFIKKEWNPHVDTWEYFKRLCREVNLGLEPVYGKLYTGKSTQLIVDGVHSFLCIPGLPILHRKMENNDYETVLTEFMEMISNLNPIKIREIIGKDEKLELINTNFNLDSLINKDSSVYARFAETFRPFNISYLNKLQESIKVELYAACNIISGK